MKLSTAALSQVGVQQFCECCACVRDPCLVTSVALRNIRSVVCRENSNDMVESDEVCALFILFSNKRE